MWFISINTAKLFCFFICVDYCCRLGVLVSSSQSFQVCINLCSLEFPSFTGLHNTRRRCVDSCLRVLCWLIITNYPDWWPLDMSINLWLALMNELSSVIVTLNMPILKNKIKIPVRLWILMKKKSFYLIFSGICGCGNKF